MPDGRPSASLEPGDIVSITQLQAQYGHVLDDQAWDQLGLIFTEDVEANYNDTEFRGLPALTAFFVSANASSAHHGSNVFVYEEGGEVRVRSKFFVPYTRSHHEVYRWAGGNYEDVVVRTDAGWRISRRQTTARWQMTMPQAEPIPARRQTW